MFVRSRERPSLCNPTWLELALLKDGMASHLQAERELHRQQLQQAIADGEGQWQRFEDVVQRLAGAEDKLEAAGKENAASAAEHRRETAMLERHVREMELNVLEAASNRAADDSNSSLLEARIDALSFELDEATLKIGHLAAENEKLRLVLQQQCTRVANRRTVL